MLGGVLCPVQPFADENRLPEHALELANLGHEPHLLIKPLHPPIGSGDAAAAAPESAIKKNRGPYRPHEASRVLLDLGCFVIMESAKG